MLRFHFMGQRIGPWEVLKPLAKGGQGQVSLVRRPARVQERNEAIDEIFGASPWTNYLTQEDRRERIERLAPAMWKYARPETADDLAALKQFTIPDSGPDADEAVKRLRNEILILRQPRPGLVKLIDANENERWMVTEFMSGGTLFNHPTKYKGDAYRALKAFRSLVETVAGLHKDNLVHRDIKPANVFLGVDESLVLGDFGLIFLPEQPERPTMTNERVGPRDYMPQWADLGERLENVQPNFDVYMLGKLLWCMVSGRLKLPREYHKRPAYDVTALFPNDPSMRAIGDIIGHCVVEEPEQCLESAEKLLDLVDESLALIQKGIPMLDEHGKFALSCRICGKGSYQEHTSIQLQVNDALNRGRSPACSFATCALIMSYSLRTFRMKPHRKTGKRGVSGRRDLPRDPL
jgi:serine/threonine protein kinase